MSPKHVIHNYLGESDTFLIYYVPIFFPKEYDN